MSLESLLTQNNQDIIKYPIQKRKGANIKTIIGIEQQLRIHLPNDFVTFYLLTNGLEGDNLLFTICPIESLTKQQDQFGFYLEFAEYMINLETCGVELVENDKSNYKLFIHEKNNDGNEHRRYIAESLEDFLLLFMNEGAMGIWGAKD